MIENEGTKAAVSGEAGGARGDLVSLADAPVASGEASAQDSILSSAHAFEEQLEQMTAWKHQLAQQMELMRRDGIKLLERQKGLSQEKKRLQEEREALGADRARVEQLQTTLGAEAEALRTKETEIEEGRASIETARHEWTQREAEVRARELGLAEQEAKHLSEGVRLREALEQLEEQRKQLVEAQRAVAREKETLGTAGAEERQALDALSGELGAREGAIAAKSAEIGEREARFLGEKAELEAARRELSEQQEKLVAAERNLAQRALGVEGDLEAQLRSATAARAEAEAARDGLMKQRRELEKNLGEMETELSGQLEALAKQTQRLTERRNEVEARSAALEKEFEMRVAEETERLRGELAKSQSAYEERAAILEQEFKQKFEKTSATSAEWEAREVQLRAQLETAGKQLEWAKEEIATQTTQFAEAESALQGALVEEMERWRKKLEAALAENERLQAEQAELAVLEGESGEEEAAGKIAALTQEIEEARSKLAESEERGRALEEQLANAGTGQMEALGRQVEMLEQQRNDLAAQLFEVQDALKRQMETELSGAGTSNTEESEEAQEALGNHRERLLRQARNLRAYRKQVRETKTTLENHREEIASQREQLRSRKENLEQVKRLLEKQEMVMARKLADHSAVKTVAAVGIFVIMILGSVFAGVYKFVNPSFRSEAVIQLAPPTGVAGADLQAWMGKQVAFIKSDDVTFAAWKMLRTPDEHYAMHDVREEWLASLPNGLVLKLDAPTKTVAVQYSGPNAEGVAQVCNAVATSYATPTARDGTVVASRDLGMGAAVLAKASVPLYPVEDNRLMMSLSIVAVVLFLSLILVIVFRHYVARQLREIDQMADDKDLEDIKSEMAAASS